jgi:flagellar motor switch protein FliM
MNTEQKKQLTAPPEQIIGRNPVKELPVSKIKKYDFKRPDKFSKDQIRTVQMMHEVYARLSSTILSMQLRSHVHMHVASVDQMTYREFSNSIPNPTLLSIINMAPLKGSAVLEIDPDITFSFVDRLFGGKGETIKTKREITDIEQSVLEGLVIRNLKNLSEAWSNVVDLQPKLSNVETSIQFAQIVPPNDMIIIISFETHVEDVKGMINLCIPYITIESIVNRLTAQYWYSSIRRKGETLNDAVSVIGNIKADSRIFFRGVPVTLTDLTKAEKGDVIPLGEYKDKNLILESGGSIVSRFEHTLMKPGKSVVLNSLTQSEHDSNDWVDEDLSQIRKESPKEELEQMIRPVIKTVNQRLDETKQKMEREFNLLREQQNNIAGLFAQESKGSDKPKKNRFETGTGIRPFAFVHKVDSQHVSNFLQSEHPQTIALILSYLNPEKASEVLERFPEELQVDVSTRIAVIDRTTPEVLREVERVLVRKFEALMAEDFTRAGGLPAIVQILNLSNRSVEKHIIETLEKDNPELAENIKRSMFVFEDIVLLSDSSVERVLEIADKDDIAKAIKSVDAEVKEKIFRNLQPRELDYVKKKCQDLGPMRITDVEGSQQAVVNVIRRLEEDGEIIVARADEMLYE